MRLSPQSARLLLLVPVVVAATALLGPAAVPLVVALGFLAAGWYPGEDALDRLREVRLASPPPARPRDASAPALPCVVDARPGRLVAGGLVRRGPPVLV